jgi:hypothetical protein
MSDTPVETVWFTDGIPTRVRHADGQESRSTNGYEWVPSPKVFTLEAEGEAPRPVDLAEFYRDNDLEPEEVNAIGRMQPGDEKSFGGGAGVLFTLRRVS